MSFANVELFHLFFDKLLRELLWASSSKVLPQKTTACTNLSADKLSEKKKKIIVITNCPNFLIQFSVMKMHVMIILIRSDDHPNPVFTFILRYKFDKCIHHKSIKTKLNC